MTAQKSETTALATHEAVHPVELRQFIAGNFRPPHSGRHIEDFEPATGATLARVPAGDATDVAAAVEAAKAAFAEWSRVPVTGRAAILDHIADLIEAELETYAAVESRDTGKPIRLARSLDIPRAIANFRFFAGAARHDESAFHPMEQAINYTLRRPIGVVGLITPWNLPIYLLSWKVAPALVMGNTIVAKPSELTPLTADLLARTAQQAGLPDGVLNIVHGTGPEAGAAIVAHPDVKAISFTGGTATGRTIAQTAAPMLKKLSLELGGKNPTLVFADADIEKAVEGTFRAGFTNTGQICLCGSRILVEHEIHDDFVAQLVRRVERATLGDPQDPHTELGALISAQHRDKVEGYLQVAAEEGGKVLTGGTRPRVERRLDKGYWIAPTVITGLPQTSRCIQEEIFGPVVTVQPFASESEAVALANDVPYGLAASVWTTDLARAHRVSAHLETGMVWVNTWLLRDLRVPFGGMKASGIGREGGRYSLDFFSEARNVCVDLS
jgi:aminomuconate-semialdehyde/2-hydroxymuconate-6-semialdehyde dehydrogenase